MIPSGLRGKSLVKRFGRVAALRGIDFEIAAGEAVAILGANGAGKSTLLRILAGLSRPTEGDFEAFTQAPVPREHHRALVGYVGHATLLYGELTAAENLRFAARLAGSPLSGDRLTQLLEQMNLAEVADRRAGTFSRGMSQRLSIARAIVHEPTVLLLDEPFTGLDGLSAERLSENLAQLRSGGRTLVLITHDPQRAAELTDRALILQAGRIAARPGSVHEPAYDAETLRALLGEVARGEMEGAA